MIFDVLLREGFNESNKQKINNYRVPEKELSAFLRKAQLDGNYIVGINRLVPIQFRQLYYEREENHEQVDQNNNDSVHSGVNFRV